MKIVIEYDVHEDGTINGLPSRGNFVDGDIETPIHAYTLRHYAFTGQTDQNIPIHMPKLVA